MGVGMLGLSMRGQGVFGFVLVLLSLSWYSILIVWRSILYRDGTWDLVSYIGRAVSGLFLRLHTF